jgi:hypothetical protein
MHQSRLMSVLIDCAEADFERGVDFWSRALGKETIRQGDDYASLRGRLGGEGGPIVMLQRVPKEERAIHLDIETDDVAAEVARLEKLGARRKRDVQDWVVMEAPTGHAFCVIPARRPDFPAKAARWE